MGRSKEGLGGVWGEKKEVGVQDTMTSQEGRARTSGAGEAISSFVETAAHSMPGQGAPTRKASEARFKNTLEDRGTQTGLARSIADGIQTIPRDGRGRRHDGGEKVNTDTETPGFRLLGGGGAREGNQGGQEQGAGAIIGGRPP